MNISNKATNLCNRIRAAAEAELEANGVLMVESILADALESMTWGRDFTAFLGALSFGRQQCKSMEVKRVLRRFNFNTL